MCSLLPTTQATHRKLKQMALAAPSTNRLALRARAGQAGVSARPVVLMRADVKQGREYRESDDTISSPGQAPKKANDALYADQVPRVRLVARSCKTMQCSCFD